MVLSMLLRFFASARRYKRKALMRMLPEETTSPNDLEDRKSGKKHKGNCPRIISSLSPVKLYCCYVIITVLTVAVAVLSVALSVLKADWITIGSTYAICPRNWIGFGNKCFYFSEQSRNWTSSQTSCMALEAQLARFESLEELEFLNRYKGPYDHWIGLHRESSEHPWRWTDGTEYNSLVSIRGVEAHAYLNSNGISSAKDYKEKRWICSKPNIYTLQCQSPSASF